MRIKYFVVSTIVSLALVFAASPARADRGGARGRGSVGRVSRGATIARVAPRVVVAPRVIGVSPYRFARPYYAFRPRLTIGFGLWVGYPVPFPYYSYPYAYASPYPYGVPPYAYPAPPYGYSYPSPNPSASYPPPGYPPAGPVTVQPGTANGAGVSFEITPADADVFVDGNYVGRVASFGPQSQPLPVTPGRHVIEIRRSGYQTLTFDADVIAGQVIPYQGTMQPLAR